MMEKPEKMTELEEDSINAIKFFNDTDLDEWKHRRAKPLLLKGQELSSTPNSSYESRVVASLVPDEIIYNYDNYEKRNFDCSILVGDVSGFTELCDRYSKRKGGSSRLTYVLNSYIGAMVQEIMSHGGDILKFSGDAFVVVWKRTESLPMRDAVHEAIDCSLIIQKTYGTYSTDVGVIIRVKLIVSAGKISFMIIGDENNSHYLEVGQPIWDIKAADGKSGPGEVVITPSAWQHVTTNEYIHKILDDGKHIKVLGIGPNWRVVSRNIQKTDVRASDTSIQETDEYALRPAVNYAASHNLKEKLRKFIIKPVMNALDLHEPLDYLTEVRQVAIVFINVVISYNLDFNVYMDVANETYKIVCSIVSEFNGSMNKINAFDKDLMMLVIFGLRGYKLDSESEIALKCATQCYQRISGVQNVLCASVAVTTGKTYCGVFGHTLRKEYTVMSLMVNKAARLMMAYPGKVTCGRGAFIHSKLDPRYFTLMEYKPLKGITSPGPVYEFKLIELTHTFAPAVNRYPLLGREAEIKLYKECVQKAFDCTKFRKSRAINEGHHSMLVISGKRLYGKQRLLEELVYLTPNNVPVSCVPLLSKDVNLPFQTIRLLFLAPLGLTEASTKLERQKKIVNRLQNTVFADLLCCLNHVFQVDFESSNEYLELSREQQYLLTKKMIKHLAYQTFVTFWIVCLANIEFVDAESWKIIDMLLEMELLFLISTLNSEEPFKKKFKRKVRVIKLQPLDKIYHSGLSCQLMHVDAITPELEQIVQKGSEGRPGWMENFLISLIQAGEVIIKNITQKEAYDLGLVIPPYYMIKRITETERKMLMKDELSSDDNQYLKWNMYSECYRESFKNLTDAEKIEKQFRDEKVITVAIINPDFKTDADLLTIEVTMDVLMIKTFDSLNSYEQLVVKCSSTLCANFPRDMLAFVMNATSLRKTAIAVKTLFENRVLSCARGDFLDGNNMMVFKGRLLDPNIDTDIKCECRGLIVPDSCYDLPKYASCGYLRFRLEKFREIIYNLLTDSQKKEFHDRAIRYIEKETRRCRACGNGFFLRILGGYKEDLRSKLRKRAKSLDITSSKGSKGLEDERSECGLEKDILSRASLSTSSRRSKMRQRTQMGSNVSVTKSESEFDVGWFGFTVIHRLRKNMQLTKTFSSFDFSECQCAIILSSMYSELIDHCKGAERTEKMMEAMLAYVYICIDAQNVPEALKILADALHILEDPQYKKAYLDWMIELKRGKIYTLLGYAKVTCGQIDEAYDTFMKALEYFGFPFPQTSTGVKMMKINNNAKHILRFFFFPNCLKGNDHGDPTFCDNLSECLIHLSQIFMYKKMWEKAELAASWGLNKAIDSQMDFIILCNAYANMITVGNHLGKRRLVTALEVYSLKTCQIKKSITMSEEIKAAAVLYSAIFCGRLNRSELIKSLEIGYIIWRLASSTRAVVVLLQTLPILMLNVIFRKQLSEAVVILQELEFYAAEDTDISGKLSFYSLCIIMQLETGYSVESFRRCERYFQREGVKIAVRDPDTRKRIIVLLWVWCVRNENWEAAKLWQNNAFKFTISEKEEYFLNIYVALYLLEGQILYLVGKIDKRNMQEVMIMYKKIEQLITTLKKASFYATVILPRLLHLKAYYKIVKFNDYKAMDDLKKARATAIKCENLLEESWINHSELVWSNALSQLEIDFWKEHCDPDNLLDYHENEYNNGKFGFFSLPIPVFI